MDIERVSDYLQRLQQSFTGELHDIDCKAELKIDPWRCETGGGFDLASYYGITEDRVHWHGIAKQACDPCAENG